MTLYFRWLFRDWLMGLYGIARVNLVRRVAREKKPRPWDLESFKEYYSGLIDTRLRLIVFNPFLVDIEERYVTLNRGLANPESSLAETFWL